MFSFARYSMQQILIGTSSLRSSRLAYGCWRIADQWTPENANTEGEKLGKAAVLAAYEAGYTLFDHADIYGRGRAEELFGRVLRDVPGMRDRIVIASKCGIRPKDTPEVGNAYRYDFSADHIIRSCEGSLRRLGIETLDLYQLHRPDYLMDPEEVATAFHSLRQSGKVKEFGVSNFAPHQWSLLQSACSMPLIANQIEISLSQLAFFENGTAEQCLEKHISPMAWSPLGGGHLGHGPQRVLGSQEQYGNPKLIAVMDAVAKRQGCSRSALALAWLLKHPSGIIPIVGSTRPERIREAALSTEIRLSREDWYGMLGEARKNPLP